MKIIPVELTLLSPLSIARRRGVDNVLQTLDFIPGSTWRGALAAEYLRRMEPTDPEFIALFAEEKAWFGDMRLQGAKVIPRTAFTCKYNSGFNMEDYYENHGVRDVLHNSLKHECWGEKSTFEKCEFSDCEAPLVRFLGYYSENESGYRCFNPLKTLIGRTQIDSRSHTAKEATLYTLEVIEPQQSFSGELRLTKNGTFTLLNKMLEDGTTIWVGSDQSRGFGQAYLSRAPSSPSPKMEDIETLKLNLENFNKELSHYDPDLLWFALTLDSRAIVLDCFLRYKSCIGVEDLYDAYESEIWENFYLVRGWNVTATVDGWNSKVMFPKLSEIAIAAGSVFVFAARKANTDYKKLCDALLELQIRGIGVRRPEGFGFVSICDSFHDEEVK